jgi:hypothetical protein
MVKLLSNLLLSTSKNNIRNLKKCINNNTIPIDGYILTESLPLIKSENMRQYIFTNEKISNELLIYLTDKPERYTTLLSLMNSNEIKKYDNMFDMLFNVIRRYGSYYNITFYNDIKLIDILSTYKESEYHINYNDYNDEKYNNITEQLYVDLFIDCDIKIILDMIFGKDKNIKLVLELVKNDCIDSNKLIEMHEKLSLCIHNLYKDVYDYYIFRKEPFVSKNNYENYKKNTIELLKIYI